MVIITLQSKFISFKKYFKKRKKSTEITNDTISTKNKIGSILPHIIKKYKLD